jgi:hypothetical protein
MKTKKPKTKLAKFLGEEKLYTFNNKPWTQNMGKKLDTLFQPWIQ